MTARTTYETTVTASGPTQQTANAAADAAFSSAVSAAQGRACEFH
jgi:hypothetical protein